MKVYTGIQQLKFDSEILEIVAQALLEKGALQWLSEPVSRRVCALKIGDTNMQLHESLLVSLQEWLPDVQS